MHLINARRENVGKCDIILLKAKANNKTQSKKSFNIAESKLFTKYASVHGNNFLHYFTFSAAT